MRTYRVRERDWADARCARVTAQSPQGAAECYVECRDQRVYDRDEVEVVVLDDGPPAKRHNIVVTVEVAFRFDARKPRDLQKEEW